jgi:hypothetical protein
VMPTQAQIRASIQTVLAGVAGIGSVHDYFRLAALEADLKTKLVTDGRLHAWLISLSDEEPLAARRLPACQEQGTWNFVVRGYYAVADAEASEKTFSTVTESVVAAFRADKKLGNTVIEAGPAQWTQGGYRMFAGVLCHFAQLALAVRVQLEP